MHVQGVLQRLGFLEHVDGELGTLVGRERLVALDIAAAVPEEHAAAVQRPHAVLGRLARHAVRGQALVRLAGEQHAELRGASAGVEEKRAREREGTI